MGRTEPSVRNDPLRASTDIVESVVGYERSFARDGSAARAGNEADKTFKEARFSVRREESAERKSSLDPRADFRREPAEAPQIAP